jgi:drug/metabolite transporter (DMT)-like permease
MTATPNNLATTRPAALAGIGLMLLGVFLFSCNDALGKWLLGTYSVGQMLFIRSVAAMLVLIPFIWRAGAAPFAAAPRPRLQIVRVLLSTLEVVMFFVAVSYLPLADTVAFYLAAPIFVTALSALFLGEQVGWRRWTAVLVGFVGVILTLRPSTATLTWPALIALAGSFFFSLLMITTRMLRGTADVVFTTGQVGTTLVFATIAAPFGWITPSLPDLLGLALLGIVAIVALTCVNRSLKLSPASVVVPYQYTLIVWAILFGYTVFGDVPDLPMLFGSTIIVAAGLYIFWREQAVGRGEETFTPPP